ncbi:MAG: hypothetical protein EAZ07_07225 [Cytophagales bacterium]|nr:MAG: hypothetical protein EAZ07_07225 [Cytophagales bacterium]
MLKTIGPLLSIKRTKFLLLLIIGINCNIANAQYKFSSDPAVFVTEVTGMLNSSKSAVMQQASLDFQTAWTNYDISHQKKIIELAQKMLKTKKYRPNPHFLDFFGMLTAAKNKNLNTSQIDSMIWVSSNVTDKLNVKQVTNYFSNLKIFLESSYLYKSKFNTLYAEGGTYSFNFINSATDIPLPDDTSNIIKNNAFNDFDNPQKAIDDWGTLPSNDTTPLENIYDVGYISTPQPPIEGPIIKFQNINLVISTPYDSIAKIEGTNGALMLNNNIFVGKGGKMDWSTAGIPSNDAYCTFEDYNFNIKSSKVIVETATLNYPSKSDKPIKGIFEYDSKRHTKIEDNYYPRFKSYTSNVVLKGLGENIIYKGGFSLGGRKTFSSSVDEGFATIEIKHAGETKIKSISNRFELGDSLVAAGISNIVLYMGSGDSIYHPGTIFKFNKNSEILKLYKQPGYKNAPFIDTYHKIEILADALSWNLNEPKMNLGIINAREQVPAIFESEEYFSVDKYIMMKGLYNFHPLQMIVGYSERKKVTNFNAQEVADDMKIPVNTIKGAMQYLMKGGFIDYNIRSGDIRLRPKGIHYVMSRRDKKDYDNINFVSISSDGKNATLDLNSHELTVRGVDKIYISDSLRVEFIPENKELKILKNRDFKFNGIIKTKNFEFVGKDFQFNYDSFLVHLPTINSIKLMVKPKEDKNPNNRRVGNELTYSSGTLYINKPNNKSARKKFNQYPIFDAKTGASVVFNKPNIAQGAYDSTIQFKIPPFKIDSLSSNDPNAIGFDGEFISGGIFPPFKEKLVVMPDYSMGFEHKVPKEGFPLYEGKAKYYNKIILNSQGLRGEGSIQYLNTKLESKDFFFLKDSTLTIGTKATTTEGAHPDAEPNVKFPDMSVEDYKMKWLPKSDQMYISDTKKPILLYKGTASLQGTANITKKGMFGEGILLTRGSEVESSDFKFSQSRFTAGNAHFQIKSDNPTKPALLCLGVKFDFDLEKAIANFSPEVEGAASNEFPYAMYKSSLNNGVWDLHKKTINMKMPEGGDINKSYFYSTRLDQDSLVFNATEATYDITKLTLNIKGIPYIKVADAKIIPKENNVYITENAVIQTLKDSKVILDTLNEYHKLYDGVIDIRSRLRFEGAATYQYVNLGADTLAIKFQEFASFKEEGKKNKNQEITHTVATGLIKEEENLRIGPKIFYKGKVTMYAHRKYLSFDGFIKLDLKGALQNAQWLKFSNTGDSSTITISLKNATADDGSIISSGLHFDANTSDLYSTFIASKHAPSDIDIFSCSGLLNYNGERNEFSVAPLEKLSNTSAKGSLISYNDAKSSLSYISRFNFLNPNKNISILATGLGEGKIDDNKFNFNTLIAFNLKINSAIYTVIGKSAKQILQFAEDTSSQESIDNRDKNMVYKIVEIAGTKAWEKYKVNKVLNNNSLAQLSSDFSNGLVFSDVTLVWSPEHKAFHSVGPLYLSNSQKEEIGRAIHGHVEIIKSPEGDIVNIYFEPIKGAWYYINYENNRLGIVSSNDDVNAVISKKSDGEKMDRSKYFVTKSEPSERYQFMVNFYRKYYNKNFDEEAPIIEESPIIEEQSVGEAPKVIEKEKPVEKEIKKPTPENQEKEASNDISYDIDESLPELSEKEKKKAKKHKKKTSFMMAPVNNTEEETPKYNGNSKEEHLENQKDQNKMQNIIGN